MPSLVCVLRRLELFAKLRGVLCHHFLEYFANEMAATGSFSAQYRALFTRIMSTRRCGATVLDTISYAQLLAPRIQ